MISLILSFAVLIAGYIFYGRFVEKTFGPDDRLTPALEINDGVDCIPMKTWRVFLIQLLNIAGTGPIFGALMGAVFGPQVFLWIVLGSVFAGAVHDYMSGMISLRNGGESLPDILGRYYNETVKKIARIAIVILMILVGTVFVTSPAMLLATLTPENLSMNFWIVVIVLYYIVATILPIDKIIGRLYPLFGVILLVMAGGILFGLLTGGYEIPEIWEGEGRPDDLPTWPFMCITVACGAISGFHATQSPMMAKCILTERDGRKVFYGSMISESVIALIWAAAGVGFYGATSVLNEKLGELGQSGVVYDISTSMLGMTGGILAIIGVVICPISTGDTAFRTARYIFADILKCDQEKIKNRLLVAVPLFVVGVVLTQVDFTIIWRYFAWTNQTLAAITLWALTIYFLKEKENKFTSLITSIPASYMTAVTVSYIFAADEGFGLGYSVSIAIGLVATAVCAFFYVKKFIAEKKKLTIESK